MNAERTADTLFSRLIRERDKWCQMQGDPEDCWGRLEAAHLIRRGYHAVRYEPLNAVALCQKHHAYMTEHPLAWNTWRVERIGALAFNRLWSRALSGERPDLPTIIADLKQRLEAA